MAKHHSVLATCSLETSLGYSARCYCCDGPIEASQAAIAFTFFNNLDERYFAHTRCFKTSDLQREYTDKFLVDRYSIPEFRGPIRGMDRGYVELLVHFNFERVIHRIAFPGALSVTPAAQSEVDGYDLQPSLAAPALLVDVLLKTGHGHQLRTLMDRLPQHAWILLALHDDPTFQNAAARLFRLPELPAILDVLRTGHITLDHMLGIHDCVRENVTLMSAVAGAISHYGLDEKGALSSPGFSGFAGMRHAQLCYFCVPNPVFLPPLLNYLQTGEFDEQGGRFRATHRFYHRAAMLHCALYEPSMLDGWLDTTRRWVKHSPNTTGRAFVGETIHMVDALLGMRVSRDG
jgi:hypothetical protein